MLKMKQWIKNHKREELILLILVSIQIGFLLVYNVLRTKYNINFDSSEYMVQVIQIWKQKTLLIKDYYYSTMLTWDMPTLIAVVFYGIFKDVFLAYGLANNVLIILFALVLRKLCNDLEMSRFSKYLVFLATFTVYQHGLVDYIEELFVNGALYGFRILFMLLLMDILICVHKQVPLKKNIVLYVLCLIGCFVCGVSSGIFELGCCILPVLVFEIWDVLSQDKKIELKDFFQLKTILPLIAAIASAGGVLTNYLLGFEGSSAATKTTIPASEMADNVSGIIVGFFQLFGWTDTSVAITSIDGIMSVIAFAVGAAMIAVFVLATKAQVKSVQNKYRQMVFFVFLVNAMLFVLADLTYGSSTFEYRYWLMFVVPVFVEIGIVFDWAKDNVSYNYRTFIVVIYIICLSLICGYKDSQLWNIDRGADKYEEMMNAAELENLDTIFIYGDYFTGREFSSFAKESMEVFAVANVSLDDNGRDWIFHKLRMPRWGTYVKYDGDCLAISDGSLIGMFIHSDVKVCPDYQLIASKALKIISFEDSYYQLLILDKNYMDFQYGLPKKDMSASRDYFNWGYDKTNLKLKKDGSYQSNGAKGTVVEGTFTASTNGAYEITLQYEMNNVLMDEAAWFKVVVTNRDGQSVEYVQVIQPDNAKVTLENVSVSKGDTYKIIVEEQDGVILSLKQIDFVRR